MWKRINPGTRSERKQWYCARRQIRWFAENVPGKIEWNLRRQCTSCIVRWSGRKNIWTTVVYLCVFFSNNSTRTEQVVRRPSITTNNPAECFRRPIDSRFPSRQLSNYFRPKIVLHPRGRKYSGAGNDIGVGGVGEWYGAEKVILGMKGCVGTFLPLKLNADDVEACACAGKKVWTVCKCIPVVRKKPNGSRVFVSVLNAKTCDRQ